MSREKLSVSARGAAAIPCTWLGAMGAALSLSVAACGGSGSSEASSPGVDASAPADATDQRPPGTTPPSCKANESLCDGRCVDSQSDRVNCGACGKVCDAGQVCVSGRCAVTCPAPQLECGGACVSLATDRAHCGGCGRACGAGQVCSNGTCQVSCAAPLVECGGGPAGRTDAGTSDGGTASGRYCASTSDDRANCGRCGVVCAPGEVCSESKCGVVCSAGLTKCGSACTSTSFDPANCGGCGRGCGAGFACVSGVCATVTRTFSGATGAAWETRATALNAFTLPGWTDYVPSGRPYFFAVQDEAMARYDVPGDAWVAVSGPVFAGAWAGPAWVGDNLWTIQRGNVQKYSIIADKWSTLLTFTDDVKGAQNAHDDLGHIYSFSIDAKIAKYDIASSTLVFLATTWTGKVYEPRITWDSTSRLLYFAPKYDLPDFFSFDPVAATTTTLPSIPGSFMNDAFCGDRSGHIYAAGPKAGTDFWQYTVATKKWARIKDLPFDHGDRGACTVTDDGWLYTTPGGESAKVARIKLL